MDKVRSIIRRKPLLFLLISVGYLFVAAFLKWNIRPTYGTATFLIGGLLGIYFLDIAEVFFALQPSPFRTIVFVGGFIIVSLFIVTSSGSMLASGLVLSLFLALLLWQVGEWEIQKNLNDWYRMIAGPVNPQIQLWILAGCIVIFMVETIIFLL